MFCFALVNDLEILYRTYYTVGRSSSDFVESALEMAEVARKTAGSTCILGGPKADCGAPATR